jgi:hypothetical protein
LVVNSELASLAKGVYFLVLHQDRRSNMVKFVKY